MVEEINIETSQKNDAPIKIIIRMGSWAIVNVNIARGGPKAKKAHPKNSAIVILIVFI